MFPLAAHVEDPAATGRLIGLLLERPWYRLRFTQVLEDQYESATGQERAHEIRRSLLVNIVLNLLCCGLDAFVGPRIFRMGLFFRIGALLIAAPGVLLVRSRFSVWVQTVGASVAVLPWIVAACLIGRYAGQPWADRYFMAVGFSVCLNSWSHSSALARPRLSACSECYVSTLRSSRISGACPTAEHRIWPSSFPRCCRSSPV